MDGFAILTTYERLCPMFLAVFPVILYLFFCYVDWFFLFFVDSLLESFFSG